MKCSVCKTKNSLKANYCIHCSHKFTKEEKEEASKKGLLPKLKKLEEWYNMATFKVITDHWAFRTFLILFLLIPGIWSLLHNGSHIKILNEDSYKIEYNEQTKDYYIYLKEKDLDDYGKLHLNLYVPNFIDKLKIGYYKENQELIEEEEHSKEDAIVLDANTIDNNYYMISSEDHKEELKVYVYFDEEV